jgi:hypothetical protein
VAGDARRRGIRGAAACGGGGRGIDGGGGWDPTQLQRTDAARISQSGQRRGGPYGGGAGKSGVGGGEARSRRQAVRSEARRDVGRLGESGRWLGRRRWVTVGFFLALVVARGDKKVREVRHDELFLIGSGLI